MNIVPVLIAAQSAQQQKAERALIDAFRIADATAADRAQSLSRIGVERTDVLTRLEAQGVLRSVARDRYYLDEAAVVARRARSVGPSARRIIFVLALLAAVLVAIGLIMATQ